LNALSSQIMSFAPFVLVTATTEILRDIPRVRVNEAYTDALAAVGLVPLILPPIDPAVAIASLTDIAGLVLTGGEDIDPAQFGQERHPATGEPHDRRDAYELALARAAHERRIPTLAICRGMQVMNVALGGTLIQDIPSQRPSDIDHDPNRRADRVHRVAIDADSSLARVVCSTSVFTNSSHHQSVDDIGRGLKITATSDDGIVEAFEPTDRAWWMIGVQWHPEELTATAEDWDRRLFASFADAVRATGRD
jgi:putative glutamine amidotransferase